MTEFPPAARPGWRRLLDVWGFVPPIDVPHEPVTLTTRDGVRLGGSYLPGPAAPRAEVPAVLLLHGFAGHHRKPKGTYLAEQLSARAAVLALDLRGHGCSGGRCSLGDRESLDALAAAAWLRRRGHRWLAAIGLSMGGAAVVGAAGRVPGAFDAVCAISAPAEWGLQTSAQVRAIGRLVRSPLSRALASTAFRVRVAGRWAYPPHPAELAGRMGPVPLLVVHGEDDHFFGIDQAEAIYGSAPGPRTLWREPVGFGHAEDGITPAFTERLARALVTVRSTGSWPAAARPVVQARSGPERSSVVSISE